MHGQPVPVFRVFGSLRCCSPKGTAGSIAGTLLAGWLEERVEQVYKREEGYSATATSLFLLDLGSPQARSNILASEIAFNTSRQCS